ncbi:MAG TPA: hypothetical protein VGH86_14590 [Phenylobacterium sp.]|jgi:hypothetical protein
MAANHASIKLSSAFVDEARREAEVLNRSVGAQVEHWARLGRAFENTPGVGIDRVRGALEGRLKIEDLATSEREAFYDGVFAELNGPDKAMSDHYAGLGAREGAVGTDGHGGVVRTTRRRRVA